MTKLMLVPALMLSFALAARAAGMPAPAPLPEKVSCSECGMTVKGDSLRFVSEMIIKDGSVKYFCDLGDLFVFVEVNRKKDEAAAMYVRDYNTGAWVPARDACYLAGAKVVTPMRYGILAFSDRGSAEKFRKEKGGGAVYSFGEALASRLYRR